MLECYADFMLIWKMFKNFLLFNNDNMQTGYFVC